LASKNKFEGTSSLSILWNNLRSITISSLMICWNSEWIHLVLAFLFRDSLLFL
jgi:hypothetical protein